MRFKTANSSLVSGSGRVLTIYRICAYGSPDQAEFVAQIKKNRSAMDARKLSVRAWQFGGSSIRLHVQPPRYELVDGLTTICTSSASITLKTVSNVGLIFPLKDL